MPLRSLARHLPGWLKGPLRRGRDAALRLPYRGWGRLCPVCGRASRRFAPAGVVPREDAACIHCGALERHRLVWLYFRSRTDLFDSRPKRVLHVAPEPCFRRPFEQAFGAGYVPADLSGMNGSLKMDVLDIPFPDSAFDVIYCSHVLEHVADDRRAMREFRRVLRPDGWAVLLVPILAERTFEDPSVTDPAERQRLFGQDDHVRAYGPDYVDRLREAGFAVSVTGPEELAGQSERLRLGLNAAAGEIHFCTPA